MKKVIAIVLLVLLTVGLFISCNGDAIATMFGSDCYISICGCGSGIAYVYFKDPQSDIWYLLIGQPEGDTISVMPIKLECQNSDNRIVCKQGDITFTLFTSSKQLLLEYPGGSTFKCDVYPAKISEIHLDNLGKENATVLVCQCNGTTYAISSIEAGD